MTTVQPEIDYCEWDHPLVPVCLECGEPSHRAIRTVKGYDLRPVDHTDCQEGLGWELPVTCSRCQEIDERAEHPEPESECHRRAS